VNTTGSERARSFAYRLALVFIFTVPWEAAIHVGAIGRLSKALGLVAGVAWLVSVLARGKVRRPDALHLAYLAFLLWNGLTFFWSLDPTASLGGFLRATQILGMLLIIWDLVDSSEAIEAALQAYVLGAYVSVASIVASFITETVEKFPAHQRFQALGFEVDGIAFIVAAAAPAAWYLAVRPSSRRRSPLIVMMDVAYFPIASFALVLTGTRGAVLASIPTVVFVLWSLRQIQGAKRIVAPAVLVLAVVLVASFSPEGMLDRIGSIRHELTGSGVATGNYGEGNIGGRSATWSESLAAFVERPFAGVGIDAHREATPLGKEAHNLYLSVLAETGVVGFLLFSWVIWTVFARIRRLTGWKRRYWFAQLLLLAIGAMSLSLEDSKSVWIILSLALASAAATDEASAIVTPREREPISVAASRSPGGDSSAP